MNPQSKLDKLLIESIELRRELEKAEATAAPFRLQFKKATDKLFKRLDHKDPRKWAPGSKKETRKKLYDARLVAGVMLNPHAKEVARIKIALQQIEVELRIIMSAATVLPALPAVKPATMHKTEVDEWLEIMDMPVRTMISSN